LRTYTYTAYTCLWLLFLGICQNW